MNTLSLQRTALRFAFANAIAVGLVLSFSESIWADDSCQNPIGKIEYRVRGAELSKCMFPEFSEGEYPAYPRIRMYRKKVSIYKYKLDRSYSGNEAYSGGSTPVCGPWVNAQAGPWSRMNKWEIELEYEQKVDGPDCVYTNIYRGYDRGSNFAEDFRRTEGGNSCTGCWSVQTYGKEQDSRNAAPELLLKNGVWGWYLTGSSTWSWIRSITGNTICPGCQDPSGTCSDAGTNPIEAPMSEPSPNGLVFSSGTFDRLEYVDGWGDPEQTASLSVQLSEPYTDGELHNNIMNRMPAFSADWYEPDWSNYDFWKIIAYSGIDGDHVNGDFISASGNAQLQEMQFRIRIPSEPNFDYEIKWEIITLDLTTGTHSFHSGGTTLAGTGGEIVTDEITVNPPDWQQGLTPYGGYVFRWVNKIDVKRVERRTAALVGSGKLGGGSDGCGTCAETSSRNSSEMGGAFLSVSLGMSEDGGAVGQLTMSALIPTPELATPLMLLPDTVVDRAEIIKVGGMLRQVKAYQAFVDVVTDSAFSYDLRFYSPAQVGAMDGGVYTVSGTPFVIWRIENPDASANLFHNLKITEIRGSDSWVYNYSYAQEGNNWKLVYPGSVRQDEWSAQSTPVLDPDGSYRYIQINTNTVREPGGPVQYQVRRVYEKLGGFSGFVALTEETVDPQGDAKMTRYYYYEDAMPTVNFTPLKLVVRPDGQWTYYQYDSKGRVTYEFNGLGDYPAPINGFSSAMYSESTYKQYLYDPVSELDDGTNLPGKPRTSVTHVAGIEVERRYAIVLPDEVREIQAAASGVWWDDPRNLLTITKTYVSGANKGKTESVRQPDGTMTFYEYFEAANGTVTNIVCSGQPNGAGTAIVDGTKSITVKGPYGEMISQEVTDIASGTTVSREVYGNYDSFNRPQSVSYLDGTSNQTFYACCGVDLAIDRDGVVTQYGYDAMKRQTTATRLGITTSNVLDSVGRTLKTVRIGSDNSQVISASYRYNVAGDLVAETNALGGYALHSETVDAETGGVIKVSTLPNGGSTSNYYYLDGTLKKTVGSAVHGIRYTNGVEWIWPVYSRYTQQILLKEDGSDSLEWTKSYTDFFGRPWRTAYSAEQEPYPFSESTYNELGQLVKEVDPDGITTLFQYNARGEVEYTAVDMDRNGVIDFAGTDRITRSISDVIPSNGTHVRRTRTYVWGMDNQNTSTLTSTMETSVDGLRSWTTRWNDGVAVTSRSETSYSTGGNRYITQFAPDGSYTVAHYLNGRAAAVTQYASNGSQIGSVTYGYDSHGRQRSINDARNGATVYEFNNADQVVAITTPPPGFGQAAQRTVTHFNKALQATNVLNADGTSVRTEYYLSGELKKNYGSRIYPVEYTYDYAGRMKTMKTWTNYASNLGAAITTWNYDDYRGWLTNKAYADGKGPKYTYSPAGRLETRTWARLFDGQPLVTTYGYNTAGDLETTIYSDNVTPNVTTTYDRHGRAFEIGTTLSIVQNTYNGANQLLKQTWMAGPLAGLSVTNGYDQFLRRTNLSAVGSSVLYNAFYGYDTAGRLQTVTDNTTASPYSATYSYLANSPLVNQVVFSSSGATRLTTTKSYDYMNRLTSIASVNSQSVPLSAHTYTYNNANQRVRSLLADGSSWRYEYDALGQVISGKKYWNDGTPVAGQQFEYTFDDIGNRRTTKSGGDDAGASLRSANYTVNNLNQYTAREVPGFVDILGVSFTTNTVTVNGLATYRKGEYFRRELTVNNSSAPQWTSINVSATGQTPVTGNVFVPKTAEVFGYDADGNMTNDGRWAFTWDAENRLTKIESLSTGPAASKRQVVWVYDGQGRRIQQTDSTWNQSTLTYQMSTEVKFLSDGWRHIVELNAANNTRVRSYLWGLDLSGSMDGAGGVGGLLVFNSAGSGAHFYSYDGNGNVTALAKAADGSRSATYEYEAFGRELRKTGLAAFENPFRFSTKRTDNTADLVLYEYRFYSPNSGRWLSRDPLGEDGSFNLYAFVSNSSVDSYDFLGLLTVIQRYVGKSFINGVGPVGTLGSPAADARLHALAKAVGWLPAFNENPPTDAKDGEYRLYGMVQIIADCCGSSLTSLKYMTDMDAGNELPFIDGTIDMSVSSSIGTSSGNVSWITFGRPNPLVEPGMQLVQARTSVYIWHYVKVRIDCVSGRPKFTIESFRGSSYPSRRLWRNGILVGDIPQGTFSDLWRAQPGFPDFVAE